jgi:hypothetical protein
MCFKQIWPKKGLYYFTPKCAEWLFLPVAGASMKGGGGIENYEFWMVEDEKGSGERGVASDAQGGAPTAEDLSFKFSDSRMKKPFATPQTLQGKRLPQPRNWLIILAGGKCAAIGASSAPPTLKG